MRRSSARSDGFRIIFLAFKRIFSLLVLVVSQVSWRGQLGQSSGGSQTVFSGASISAPSSNAAEDGSMGVPARSKRLRTDSEGSAVLVRLVS